MPPIENCCSYGELSQLVPSITVDFSTAGIVDGTCDNCDEAYASPLVLPFNEALSGARVDENYTYNYVGYGASVGVSCDGLYSPIPVSCQIGCQIGNTQKRAYIIAYLYLYSQLGDISGTWTTYFDWVALEDDLDCVTAVFGSDWSQVATISLVGVVYGELGICAVNNPADVDAWI